MKSKLIKSSERGAANHGWLNARHTFSFAGFYNPDQVHFGMLRVFNDDIVAGGMGFGTHPHDNMEIVTIPLRGTLEHKDSMGTHSTISVGEVQIMSAGTGITHSEFNHNKTEEINLLQIWVFPKLNNITPRYDQAFFLPEDRKNAIQTVVSPGREENTLWINQDAWFSLGSLDEGKSVAYNIKRNDNGVWLFVVEGSVEVNGIKLERRDSLGLSQTNEISIKADSNTEFVLIDVPMN